MQSLNPVSKQKHIS